MTYKKKSLENVRVVPILETEYKFLFFFFDSCCNCYNYNHYSHASDLQIY